MKIQGKPNINKSKKLRVQRFLFFSQSQSQSTVFPILKIIRIIVQSLNFNHNSPSLHLFSTFLFPSPCSLDPSSFTFQPKIPLSDMGLHHRKLMPKDCQDLCYDYDSCLSESKCKAACKSICSPFLNDNLTPPSDTDHGKHNKVPTYLIITFSVVAAVFFALCCYATYVKFFSARNRSRRSLPSSRQQQEDQEETHNEFLDEEHGPVLDHPIWYIRTPGLHQSIINAITVCKYNKGEGLIEGTECSVCLSEFQEDESLRLLPKCNHAFHLPCIDTWLRSHTNCPMCRAPIVTNPAATRIPSMEPNAVVEGSLEGIDESQEMEENSGGAELRNGTEEEEQVEVERGGRRVSENEVPNMQPRRSVSLDSSSAAKISAALATVGSVQESHGNSMRKITGEANELVFSKRGVFGSKGSSSSSSRTRYLHSAPGSMKRSRSFNGKHLMSWYSRSQKKPSAVVRSF